MRRLAGNDGQLHEVTPTFVSPSILGRTVPKKWFRVLTPVPDILDDDFDLFIT
ncbi:hypothetical protein HMPREF0281_02329 [Corynebacterium ammoniagenes DSM 20306]|uniref:Uncharacterized protein n=1 Tax=Corynebacterium ammoniagenes DSM 20306 TaxID=649754 RepID=A0ABP2ICL1_CORAM|nr:hypothetical protein HMPREF0281_02329 [Corynebacterium ammoniagenes DSM 20306]